MEGEGWGWVKINMKYTIDISTIKKELGSEKPIDEVIDLGEIELRNQNIKTGQLRVEGKTVNVSEGILLQAKASGEIILTCSRCLDKFKHPLALDIEELFTFHDTDQEHFVEKDDTIEIAGVIIEALALDLDMKTLCKQDCKGLCPSCGIDLNKRSCQCTDQKINIRWNKLEELKKRLNND